MDMSLSKYILIGPAGFLFLIELIMPPFRAVYPGGLSVALGRSPFYDPPTMFGMAVTVDWLRLSMECGVLFIGCVVTYWLLRAFERLGSRLSTYETPLLAEGGETGLGSRSAKRRS
jgi:hypothetical protein